MKPICLTSIAEQVAAHLAKEIMRGTLVGELPGAKKLAGSLGVNHKTVDTAVILLENQGLLKSQGSGKPRLINTPEDTPQSPMHIAILTYEPESAQGSKIIAALKLNLINAGHNCTLSEKSQAELGWNIEKLERLVKKTKADTWIIQAGSRDILQWFSKQSFPSLALYGRFLDIPIAAAGVQKVPAITKALAQLISYGHRRIVMLSRESDRLPIPGYAQRVFLKQLEDKGIQTSSFNLPNWEGTPLGLKQVLDSLFQLTPPTALFITDILLLFPVYTHLLSRGITVPKDVSLVCTDERPEYTWCDPTIAHIRWDQNKIVNRILDWVNKTSLGKEDETQTFIDAEFFAGGTVGQAAKK